jgi:hypothetical protein
VTVTLNPVTGVLSITGDASNDAITLQQGSPGVLQVAGVGTLVNQSSSLANFALGSITEIDVTFLNGDDSVTMNNFRIAGTISIIAGSGSDTFSLGSLTATLLSISAAGPGKDSISLNNTTAGSVGITSGDNATLSLSGVNSSAAVNLMAGNNATVSVNSLTAGGDLNITIGDNAQSVTVNGSTAINWNIRQIGSMGSPLFDLENDTIKNTLNLRAGNGDNRLVLSHLNITIELLVTVGSGKNTVTADHVTALFGFLNGGSNPNNTYIDGGGNSVFFVFNFNRQ